MPTPLSVNRNSKNSVFIKLFEDKNRVLQLYREFHPEAVDITVDDISVTTLESVIVNSQYNDLGFTVGNRYVFLIEAQSRWNPNIALRILFYFVETLRRYLADTNQSEHSYSKVKVPKPELYVFYSGSTQKPEMISLSEEFFDGDPNIELKIRVLSKVDDSLSGQYIGFCKIFDEQYQLYKKSNNKMKIAKETYRICIEKGYLSEFMKEHEKEVIDMMAELFDETYMREQYDKVARIESMAEGEIKGAENEKTNTVLRMLADNVPFESIVKYAAVSMDQVKKIAAEHKPIQA